MRVEEIRLERPTGRGDRNVVTFDERELGLILFEAMISCRRPEGLDVDEAMQQIKDRNSPEFVAALKRMSKAALAYVVDRMQHSELERAQ